MTFSKRSEASPGSVCRREALQLMEDCQGISALLLWASVVTCSNSLELPGIPNEHLLTLATIEESAAITVTPRVGDHTHNYHFSPSSQISPACSISDRSSRCRRLYIDSSFAAKFVVIALLENSVGFMQFRHDAGGLVKSKEIVLSITEILQIGQCVPLEVIRYQGHPMVLCLDGQLLVACSILLNHSDVSQSSLGHCVRLRFPQTSVTYEHISNFAYFPERDEVVFVFQGVVYGITFERHAINLRTTLQDNSCDRVLYYGEHLLYVKCKSGQVFVYDLNENHFLSQEGVPIPCPSSGERFTVIQQGPDIIVRHSSGIEMSIEGRNYSSATCSQPGYIFVYDQLGGITAINSTSREKKFVEAGIGSGGRLEVFESNYCLVQTPDRITVYGTFLERIIVKIGEAQAVAIITGLTTMAATPPIPSTDAPAKPHLSSPPKLSASQWAGVAISSGVGFLIFVILVISVALPAVAGIVILKKRRCGKMLPTYHTPTTSRAATLTNMREIPDSTNIGERETNPDGCSLDDDDGLVKPAQASPPQSSVLVLQQ